MAQHIHGIDDTFGAKIYVDTTGDFGFCKHKYRHTRATELNATNQEQA